MPRLKLTDRLVERLTVPTVKQRQIDYFDTLLPAFGLRVGKNAKTWIVAVRVRTHGVWKSPGRHRIGRYPEMSLMDARKKARDVLRITQEGKNPFSSAMANNARITQAEGETFGALADRFLKEYPKKRKSISESTMSKYHWALKGTAATKRPGNPSPVADWQIRPVNEIKRKDIVSLLDSFNDQDKRVSANRQLAYMRPFFKWCLKRDLIATDPTANFDKNDKNEETARDRVLSPSELVEVWQALDRLGTPFAPVFKLLILTGQRSCEVTGMRKDELSDLDGSAPIWKLPGHRTKNGRPHTVPLAPQAVAVIKEALSVRDALIDFDKTPDCPWVFTTSGKRHVGELRDPTRRIRLAIAAARQTLAASAGRAAEPIPHWTPHDIRRTVSTEMHERGIALPHIVEAVINHISGHRAGVAGVYNRAEYVPEKRAALEAWASYVYRLLGESVVPLSRAG